MAFFFQTLTHFSYTHILELHLYGMSYLTLVVYIVVTGQGFATHARIYRIAVAYSGRTPLTDFAITS